MCFSCGWENWGIMPFKWIGKSNRKGEEFPFLVFLRVEENIQEVDIVVEILGDDPKQNGDFLFPVAGRLLYFFLEGGGVQ